jgi:hypothetical protein
MSAPTAAAMSASALCSPVRGAVRTSSPRSSDWASREAAAELGVGTAADAVARALREST